MRKSLTFGLVAAALSAALPGAAHAQLFFTDPVIARGPIEPGDPLVGLPLPGATPTEYRAALLWNFRVSLNVAALQCQFSRYLRSVDIYNAFIDHHAVELLGAYRQLEGYFRRTRGAAGQREFDQWSTRTYSGFTTFVGQASFCQTASAAGREALAARKGALYPVAQNHMRSIRISLGAHRDYLAQPEAALLSPIPATMFGNPCEGMRGRDLRRCEAANN